MKNIVKFKYPLTFDNVILEWKESEEVGNLDLPQANLTQPYQSINQQIKFILKY